MTARLAKAAPEPTRRTDDPNAVCYDHPERDWIFFDHGKQEQPVALAMARIMCETCPMATACLTFALDNHEEGIWAGTTEEQRRRMKRKSTPPTPDDRCGTPSGYTRHIKARENACDPCKVAQSVKRAQGKSEQVAS